MLQYEETCGLQTFVRFARHPLQALRTLLLILSDSAMSHVFVMYLPLACFACSRSRAMEDVQCKGILNAIINASSVLFVTWAIDHVTECTLSLKTHTTRNDCEFRAEKSTVGTQRVLTPTYEVRCCATRALKLRGSIKCL
jgi:hypothetical protein